MSGADLDRAPRGDGKRDDGGEEGVEQDSPAHAHPCEDLSTLKDTQLEISKSKRSDTQSRKSVA